MGMEMEDGNNDDYMKFIYTANSGDHTTGNMKVEGKQRIWRDYQKEIADDHFFYVRSCVRQNFFPGSEKDISYGSYNLNFKRIFMKILPILPVQGSATTRDIVPFETAMTMVARQFALMTEAGYENFATFLHHFFRIVFRSSGNMASFS